MNAKRTIIGLMTAFSLSLAPVGYATAAIQFGIADDLIVNGVDGAAPTPDVAIKGFTVFGATQAAPALEIPAAPGNIFINGYVQVSSGAYFVGNSTFAKSAYFTDGSTFTAAGKIFINDGSAGQLLQRSGSGNLTWISSAAVGDNLGSHVATTTLNMATFNIVGVSTISVSSITTAGAGVIFSTNAYFMSGNVGIGTASPGSRLEVAGGSVTITDARGLWSARHEYASGVSISSASAAQYGGVYVSSNMYFAAGGSIYNVSTITATGALTVSSVTATGIGVNAAQVWLSTINVVISSASQAQYGGVYVSSHAYFATGAGIYNVSTITVTGALTTYATMTVAGNAFSVGGSTLVVKEGNVGIGTATPQGLFQVGGGSLTVLSSGNVGIGNTNPGYLLTLGASGVSGSTIAFNGDGIMIPASGVQYVKGSTLILGNGGTSSIQINRGAASNFGIFQYQTGGLARWSVGPRNDSTEDFHFYDEVNAADRLFIQQSDGSVGIGTAAPGARLHVSTNNPTVDDYLFIVSSGPLEANNVFTVKSSGVYINNISSFTAGAGSIFVNGGSTNEVLKKAADGSMYWGSDLGGVAGTGLANYLPLWKTDTELANSRIWQAEVSASTHVYVSADIHLSSAVYFGLGVNISTFTKEGELDIRASTSTTYSLAVGTGAAYHLVVSTTGSVGVGTTAPGAKLEVAGGSITIRGSDTNSAIAGFTDEGGNYRMVVSTNGNVGIGTTAPTGRLSVQGTGAGYGLFVSTDSAGSVGNLVVTNSGNVGIATAAPQGLFQVGGGTMTVLSNGRVGIGTASPAAINHIQASVPDTYTMVVSTGAAASQYIISVSSIGVTNIKNLVIENRTSDPASPVTGQIWLRVD